MEKKIKYSPAKLALKYLGYFILAKNGKGHGVHSPFVFDFIVQVLNDKRHYYAYTEVEHLRKQLLNDERFLEIEDLGAGGRGAAPVMRRIREVARNMAKPARFGQLLFRMVNYYAPSSVLELGTSLGLTTAYLAHSPAPVVTIEGAGATAAQALRNFEALNLRNIRLLQGNFDELLPRLLETIGTPGFVFVDGNHRYFNLLVAGATADTILVFDDIHWSTEMEAAWKQIRAHPAITLTIDLFFIGIVFFRKEIKVPQHFMIRF
jgi:predicted O-methyltransferase YrrM